MITERLYINNNGITSLQTNGMKETNKIRTNVGIECDFDRIEYG